MATFTNTQRGCQKLLHKGFSYNKIRTALNGRIYWRCDETSLGCKGSAVTDAKQNVKVGMSHIHAPSSSRVKFKVLKSDIKEAAADVKTRTRDIVESAMEKLNNDIVLEMSDFQTLQRIVSRKRKSLMGPTPNLSSFAEVEIPQNLRLTRTGTAESFILEDTGPSDPDRIIILSSTTDICRLMQCQAWAVNGSLKSDNCWYHLWVFYGVYYGMAIPLVYSLLPNNQEDSYERALNIILRKTDEGLSKATPTVLIFDFDKTTERTFKKLIPNIKLHGCFYYFNQWNWRKMKEFNLIQNYERDDYYTIIMRSFSALAFLPLKEVELTFESLVEELADNSDDDSYKAFVDYFMATWIGRRKPRITPEFAIDVWNCSNVSVEELPHSTNVTESWRHTFFSIFHNYHSKFYKLIEELLKQQAKVHSICEELEEGKSIELFTTAEFRYVNENLFAIIRDYKNEDIGNFLKACCNYINYTD